MGMGGRGFPIGPPGAGFSVMPPTSRDLVSVLPVPDRGPFLANASFVATTRAIVATSIGRTRIAMAKHLSTFIDCPLARSQHDAACRKIGDLARNEIRGTVVRCQAARVLRSEDASRQSNMK